MDLSFSGLIEISALLLAGGVLALGAAMLLGVGLSAPCQFGKIVDRVGLDIDAMSAEESKKLLNRLTKSCGACRQRVACESWLDHRSNSDSYLKFCPNASFFNRLRGRENRRKNHSTSEGIGNEPGRFEQNIH